MRPRHLALTLSIAAALTALSARVAAGPTIPELVEIADITSLSASPSGRMVAFRVERASIEHNGYSLDWYVADIRTGNVRRIADGGAPIDSGLEPLGHETIVWSADEDFVFYRALMDGAIGVWRAAVDGAGSRPVVIADADVESVIASPDGRELVYVLGPSRAEIERAERREYDEGILVDGSIDLDQNLYRGGWVNGRLASQRLVGQWVTRAGLLWRAPRHRYRLDLRSLESRHDGGVAPPMVEALTPASASRETSVREPGRPLVHLEHRSSGSVLKVEDLEGTLTCVDRACAGRIAAIAWRPATDDLAFTTQDGHYRQTLHLWDLGSGKVRTIARAEGLLSGSRSPARPCAFTRAYAICVAASAVSPPQLERVDLETGERTVLFDPNSMLRTREMPRVEQLTWTLDDRRQATGTLLFPSHVDTPAPLFLSYYTCPGFLRAAAGDEYPLLPLVDAGFVVACLNTVPDDDVDAVADYRTGLASVEELVASLAKRGLIDPARVGMGGFSFGSEVTMWVAMNSQVLAAAAVASAQYAPSDYWSNALPGRDYVQVLKAFVGLGSPDTTPERWRLVSPALNTERIKAPLLMQLPENEARGQAELYSRLASTSTPVELYAFPDEKHRKFQPRHRLAAYRRSADWFRYWLQGHIDPDPVKADQYRRWEQLRLARGAFQVSNARSQTSAAAMSSNRM